MPVRRVTMPERINHPRHTLGTGESILMNTLKSVLAAATLAVALTACSKEETPVVEEAAVALVAPAADDDAGWRQYLQAVVRENLGTISNPPFLYYLPPESDPEFADKYGRQVESATTAMSRGVQPGNMLAFGSSASAKMADLIETAFKPVEADTLKGVRVLFIGNAADNARVMAIVQPTGAEYIFVEAK